MLILTVLPVCGIRQRDGGILGKNGDAALAFEVVGIHDAFRHLLVLAEGVTLAQETIHEGGLAVVDVGDDGNISEVSSFYDHGYSSYLLLCSIQKPPTGRPRVSIWKIEVFGERR